MGNFSMRQLGLSPDEAKALIACAHDRRKDVQSRVSEYDLQEESRTLKTLKKAESEGKVLPHQVFELLAVRNLMGASVERFLPLKFEAKYETEHGYFTEHESFGCMSHSCPTSTHPTFVGTPTLDSTMVCLRFHRASLKSTRQSTNEPTLGDTSTMYEFDLSADQFAGLMRDSNAGSPCAIGRQYLVSLDMPPRMVATVGLATEAGRQATIIVKPLMDACRNLRRRLQADEKIGTKAEYAELLSLTTAVQEAMDAVRSPLRALLAETSGQMAESATRQLLAEIAEPLKALGMDTGEVLRLMH